MDDLTVFRSRFIEMLREMRREIISGVAIGGTPRSMKSDQETRLLSRQNWGNTLHDRRFSTSEELVNYVSTYHELLDEYEQFFGAPFQHNY